MAGNSTVGLVIVIAAGAIGYEALQLMRPKANTAAPDAAQPTTGAAVGQGGTPPTDSLQAQGAQAWQQLPGTIQGDINSALSRYTLTGRINANETGSWQNAMALLLTHENAQLDPGIVNPYDVNGVLNGPGPHAVGLFQVIPDTFARFVQGGSITNGTDSAVAAIGELLNSWGGNPWAPLQQNPYKGY